VTNGRHKLIHYYNRGEWEFFDLEKDPSELKSGYDDPEYAGAVNNMKIELERLRKQYRVPATDPDKRPRKKPGKQAKPQA
jgi:hypothetical protein